MFKRKGLYSHSWACAPFWSERSSSAGPWLSGRAACRPRCPVDLAPASAAATETASASQATRKTHVVKPGSNATSAWIRSAALLASVARSVPGVEEWAAWEAARVGELVAGVRPANPSSTRPSAHGRRDNAGRSPRTTTAVFREL